MGFVLSVLVLALTIVSAIDVIRRADDEIRYLPKIVWLLIVLLFTLIGPALWWALGRVYAEPLRLPARTRRTRQNRRPAPAAPSAPFDARSTEQQIADLDKEIEEWRLRAELEKRRKAAEDPGNPLGE